LLLFGTVAVNAVAAPYISELHASGKRAELQRLVTLAAKGLTAYAVPLALVLVLGGPWILAWFGEGFERATVSLDLLVLGRLVTCLAGTVGFLLALTGHQGRVARLMTGCAAVKLLLNLLLIPDHGAAGASFATLVMLVLFTGLAWRDVRRLVGVEPTLLAMTGWLPAAPPGPDPEQQP
jgi:O-antigen/teichoic acid export membrane protein